MQRKFKTLLVLGALTLVLIGCYTVPETGRHSLNFISPQMETQLGLSEFERIKQETPISRDPVLNAQLQRVGRRIAQTVGGDMPSAQWEFVVFDAPDTLNAFALPGGKVGVYSGIFDLVESDDELAVVVSHEIAHVTARHGGERMSHQATAAIVGIILNEALDDEEYKEEILLAYGVGVGVGVMLPYSRSHELEADEVGLIYMAKSGYDPRSALDFWMKMSIIKNGSNTPAFLSTHPTDDRRIQQLDLLMPRAVEIYSKGSNAGQ